MTDASRAQVARGAPRPRSPRSRAFGLDLVVCVALVAVATLSYAVLQAGSVLRLLLALPALFFVPGYLLAEAAAGPAKTAASRGTRVFVALGTSPAIVGLLAVATAILPGGFRPTAIVTLLTVACLVLVAAASWRRMAHSRRVIRAAVAG